MWYIHAVEYYPALKKEGHSDRGYNVINLENSKCNESGPKGQHYIIPLIGASKMVKFIETESEATRVGGGQMDSYF